MKFCDMIITHNLFLFLDTEDLINCLCLNKSTSDEYNFFLYNALSHLAVPCSCRPTKLLLLNLSKQLQNSLQGLSLNYRYSNEEYLRYIRDILYNNRKKIEYLHLSCTYCSTCRVSLGYDVGGLGPTDIFDNILHLNISDFGDGYEAVCDLFYYDFGLLKKLYLSTSAPLQNKIHNILPHFLKKFDKLKEFHFKTMHTSTNTCVKIAYSSLSTASDTIESLYIPYKCGLHKRIFELVKQSQLYIERLTNLTYSSADELWLFEHLIVSDDIHTYAPLCTVSCDKLSLCVNSFIGICSHEDMDVDMFIMAFRKLCGLNIKHFVLILPKQGKDDFLNLLIDDKRIIEIWNVEYVEIYNMDIHNETHKRFINCFAFSPNANIIERNMNHFENGVMERSRFGYHNMMRKESDVNIMCSKIERNEIQVMNKDTNRELINSDRFKISNNERTKLVDNGNNMIIDNNSCQNESKVKCTIHINSFQSSPAMYYDNQTKLNNISKVNKNGFEKNPSNREKVFVCLAKELGRFLKDHDSLRYVSLLLKEEHCFINDVYMDMKKYKHGIKEECDTISFVEEVHS